MNQNENKAVQINDELMKGVSGGSRLEENQKVCRRCGGIMERKVGTSYYLCDNCGCREAMKR